MILWNYIGLLILFSSQIKLNIIQINLVNVNHLIDCLLINLGDIFHCFCEGEAPKVKKLNQYITSHQFIQARNQIFFRAGEVSWNEVTFINISSKIKWNKGRGGKFRRCLSFWTVDLTYVWAQSGSVFLKSWHCFDSQKRAGEASAPTSPSCAPVIYLFSRNRKKLMSVGQWFL